MTETQQPAKPTISYSQITLWRTCRRRWWYERVAKERLQKPTKSQERGSQIHRDIEDYYRVGKHPTDPVVSKALRHLPPRTEPCVPEEPWSVETDKWIARGVVDLVQTGDQSVTLWDYKTSKNPAKYGKRRNGAGKLDLAQDTQLLLYAHVWYTQKNAKCVYIRHHTISTDPELDNLTSDSVYADPTEAAKAWGALVDDMEILLEDLASVSPFTLPNDGSTVHKTCKAWGKWCPHIFACEAVETQKAIQIGRMKRNANL